jgi:hypothetical protein
MASNSSCFVLSAGYGLELRSCRYVRQSCRSGIPSPFIRDRFEEFVPVVKQQLKPVMKPNPRGGNKFIEFQGASQKEGKHPRTDPSGLGVAN